MFRPAPSAELEPPVVTRPHVFVTRRIPEVGLDVLRAVAEVEVWLDPLPPPREVLLEKTAHCQGLLCLLTERIDGEVFERAPQLLVVSNMAVGHNNIDVAEATRRGVRVGNTPGVLTEATADLTVALLLAAARRLVDGCRFASSGDWKTWDPLGHLGQELHERTVGIVGLGRIGAAVARRLRFGWNMRVLYASRSPKPAAELELGATRVELDRLLTESDFVVAMTDLNPSTAGMFDAGAFRRMKRTAVFINASRGGVVNQADLIAALEAGDIFAAGLDVTDPEPPPPDDPIYSAPNLVLTPHIASATFEARSRMAEMAAKNVVAGLAGVPLPHAVNPEVETRTRKG
jgi:glyoxylate reductase